MSYGITISKLIVFITLFILTLSYAQTPNREESAVNLGYVPGELLVRFKPKQDGQQRSLLDKNQILSSLNGGVIIRDFKIVPGLTLVKLPAELTVENALQTFKNVEGILDVQPNHIYKALTLPNDIDFNSLWAMHNMGQTGGTINADINAPEAWSIVTDSNVIVAVIDTGVDYTHPDLAGNMWINQAELNGIPGVDDDNNGYIDDIYGYDFCTRYGKLRDSDPMDDLGHGTYCAGTIGAIGDNSIGVTGVCWNVKIMAIKYLASDGSGDTADAIDCIGYAVDMGAKVLNNSWGGGGYNQYLETAIRNAGVAGVLFVAAAGNEWWDNDYYLPYPASYDCNNIISVLATNHNDYRAWYSNYGANSVDLGAPGGEGTSEQGILSTVSGGGYQYMAGTSMAAPHVAGACALIWAANPRLTYLQVKEVILQSVDKLDSLEDLCVSEGRLNLHKAVKNWPLRLTKTDNIEDGQGVIPYDPLLDNLLEYTICYDACGTSDTNVVLIDFLPDEVNYNNSIPQGSYNSNAHIVTWQIGTMGPNDSNCFVLNVKVNSSAISGRMIVNTCQLSGDSYTRQAFEKTPVECTGGSVVYVDINAPAGGNGASWAAAYNNLQTALSVVRMGYRPCARQIWVAKGTYKPTEANDPEPTYKTFQMINGIDIYGHFDGNETSINQRNLANENFETIFTGDTDGDNHSDVSYVVTTTSARLDGFTVKKGYNSGIYSNAYSPTIENCIIRDNVYYGIYGDSSVLNTNLSLVNCFVEDNDSLGIYCYKDEGNPATCRLYIDRCTIGPNNSYGLYASSYTVNATDSLFIVNRSGGIGTNGMGSNLIVERCDISDNSGGGIFYGGGGEGNATIQRCTIQRNAGEGLSSRGAEAKIMLNIISNNNGAGVITSFDDHLISNLIYDNNGNGIYSNSGAEIRSNTIANNAGYGIVRNYGNPTVNSNIIWDNNKGSLYDWFGSVNYNCIQNYTGDGTGNITSNPQFRDADTNDYHLAYDSNCIDKGDPCFNDANLFDIDGEDRIMDGDSNGVSRVDIGADEFYWSPADFDKNAIVNFIDYASLAKSWQLMDANKSLDDDNDVDVYDLLIFCEDWLWTPDRLPEFDIGGEGAYFADNSGGGEEMMMSMESQQEFSMVFEAEQESMLEDDGQSMMAGQGETASIYLICDVNEPNSSAMGWLTPGDEVTVQVYSDVPLFCMELGITITGDANITDAMSTADCNEYGWDPDWPTDPLIDPTGWVYISGVKWESDADGVVGYIKFRYNGGQVSVSITEGDAFDANCEPVLFSGEALTFGESE